MTPRRAERALWLAVLVGTAAAAVALTAERLDLAGFQSLELGLYDRALRTFSPRPERSKDLVLVAIDDRTFQEVRANPSMSLNFGNWPYFRSFWSELTTHLVSEGARAVALDMVLDEAATDPAGDQLLGEAIAGRKLPFYVGVADSPSAPELPRVKPINAFPGDRTAPVQHVSPEAETETDPFGAPEPPLVSPEEAALALAFPVEARGVKVRALPSQRDRTGALRPAHPLPPIAPILRNAPGFGLVHLEEDRDGVLRRTRFAYTDERNTYVTLPVAVAADLFHAPALVVEPGRLTLGARQLRISGDGTALIDYRGGLAERFTLISAFDVLNDAALRAEGKPRVLPDGLFRGKVVLVGGTAIGTADVKASPFASQMHGVGKQAAILDALLGGRFLVEAAWWVSALLAWLAATLVAVAILRWRSIVVEIAALPVMLGVVFVITGVVLVWLQQHVLGGAAMVASALAIVASTATNHLFASQERERLQAMFSKYLSSEVVRQLADQEELPRLSGERMEITAFFSDIRGFSTFSEKFKADPEGLVAILNTYLTRVSAVLQTHGACLDKYIGDAIVCIFGAPVRHKDHAVRACRAALAARAEVDRIREEFADRGLPDVYTRIGVNTAVMFVGNIGSEQLFNYTAIGDGMNLAARLEGANKGYGTSIMIGPETYAQAKDVIEARELDAVRVAGKTEAVTVYELLAEKGKLSAKKREVVDAYARGLALYRAGRFSDALAQLQPALAIDPQDGPTATLIHRCEKLLAHPPEGAFEAVTNLEK